MKKYFLLLTSLFLFSVNFAHANITGDEAWRDCFREMSEIMGGRYGMGGYGMMSGFGGGFGGFLTGILAVIFWIIFWAIFIVALVALVRWLYMKIFKAEPWILGKKETPAEVVKLRYAKGEISKEQYEEMKKELAK